VTPRDRTLATLLGGLLVTAVVGFAGYFFVYAPLQQKTAQADTLAAEVADLEAKRDKARKDLPRLQTALKRSLPANVDQSRQEYDAVITQLMRDAKVPRTSLTVKPKAVDGKAPELAPKRPAYTRVGLEVNLTKVSLATVIDVLKRYYQLNLLQQITKFSVKRSDQAKDVPLPAGSMVADRADLDVTLMTEAIVLDGAESRRSLLPVPVAFGAVGGGAGLLTLEQSPVPARGLTPLQLVRTLAATDRDYSLLLVKDLFHGPPPPPLPVPPTEVVPPKEDTSPFIRVTQLGRNPDGSGTAVIEDLASRQQYLVDLAWADSKLTPAVTKFYYSLKGARKSYDAERDLDISEATSGTARQFRVIGFAEDGLVVADLAAKAAPAPKPTGRPARGGKSPAKVSTEAAAESDDEPATEKVYLWKLGQSLDQATELKGAERDKAVRAAQGLPATPDVAPMPRPAVD